MTWSIPSFLIFLACAAPLAAADDCALAADACAAGARTSSSPFLKASLEEGLPTPSPALRKAALKAAPPRERTAAAPEAAPPAAPAGGVEPPEPAVDAPRAGGAAELSSPLWLLFIGGGLAALYFYLAGARRKNRKR